MPGLKKYGTAPVLCFWHKASNAWPCPTIAGLACADCELCYPQKPFSYPRFDINYDFL
jgi:hypothetical protein